MNNHEAIYNVNACINCNEGAYLVIAGPGTGKTETISKRILNLVQRLNVKPEEILCLTFTNSGVEAMNKRFEEKGVFGVDVYTFHSFCSSLIDENPQDFNLPSNYSLITDASKYSILKDCLDSVSLSRTKLFKDCVSVVEKIKRTRITEEEFRDNLAVNPDWSLASCKTKDRDKLVTDIVNTDIYWKVYESFNQKLKQNNLIDFNDLINSVLDRFSNDPKFLEEISQKYRYILVDEYQDTNESQNELVFQLGKAIKNIFVVGDDDQMIFGFQGASSKTMGQFLKQFPEAEVFCLTTNYRSNQAILDLAEAIATQDTSRLVNSDDYKSYKIKKQLTSHYNSELQGEIRLTKYSSEDQEKHGTILAVKELVQKGIKSLNEIVIIVSNNVKAKEYTALLNQIGVPAQTSSGFDLFSVNAVLVLLHYLQVLSDSFHYSGSFLMTLRAKPFEFTPDEFCKVRLAVKNQENAIEALRKMCKEQDLHIKEFLSSYDHLNEYRSAESLHNTILETLGKTGILKYYTETNQINKTESIAGLSKFIEMAEEFSKIKNTQSLELFLKYIEELQNAGEDVKVETEEIPLNAVQVMTFYKSKGLQFEYVFMPDLGNRNFESSTKPIKDLFPFTTSALESEKAQKKNDSVRRLFVGVTRAKRCLYMSYTKKLSSIIQEAANQNNLKTEEKKEYASVDEYWEIQKMDLAKEEFDYTSEFKNYLTSIIASKQNYSATELNTYISCPRHYYLDKILKLNSNAGNKNDANYGTAIHSAMEYTYKQKHKTGSIPAKSDILEVFIKKLEEQEITNFATQKALIDKGKTSISSFLDYMDIMKQYDTEDTEKLFSLPIGNTKFIGYIDRIDKDRNGEYWIFDYKTGTPRTHKDVRFGGEHENYYRQLGIYKYAYEKLHPEVGHVKTALLFPDGNDKDGFMLELSYTHETLDLIFQDYQESIEKIKNLQFDQCSNLQHCQFCPFRKYFCTK